LLTGEGAAVPVDVIIPALDEQEAIGQVVVGVLRQPRVRSVIVVDNGSTDRTAEVAREAGATVVREPARGYGAACLAGMAALPGDAEVVVFVDGDASDDPDDLPELIAPIMQGRADLVVGSRALGRAERGALTWPQRVGNRIASTWLRRRFGMRATDLGPFRAIRASALAQLGMRDRGYGWTVEMQIRAARGGLRYAEVSVSYRRRIGQSKISGTVRGVVGASTKILGMLAYYDLLGRRPA
jgi:glycosyltransferase involved in cell wall biosynthesis